jgi:hypothetical protein
VSNSSTRGAVLCCLALLGIVFTIDARAQSTAPVAIPEPLRDWQAWVLHGEDYRRCPFRANAWSSDASSYRCVWPERLTLSVSASGGSFAQRWQVFGESWIVLPGSAEHWPRDVRSNGVPAAVVLRDGLPSVRLAAGSHALTGRFAWTARPEELPLAPLTALIDLTVDGQRIAQPERPNNAVFLGKRRSAEQPAAMEVQVYRLVQDDIPVYLVTRVRLQVAGEAREELLARVLPEGFVPLGLNGSVPARLEPDGRLRVQVRPGSHELTLVARGASVATELTRPRAEGRWAREEVWSFAGNDRLRVAAAEGVDGIDPAQANVPGEWQRFPAFRMAADSKLTIVERSRGLANADENRLQLARQLWLDFDHKGFTAVDNISGMMRRDWRLDMQAPFKLESAQLNGEPLLVTLGAKSELAGVELRTPQLNLMAVARTQKSGGTLPATGWASRFEQVSGTLHLPPGHRLLAAVGADSASSAWLDRWGLWNVFGVLIVVVFVYWAAGLVPALIAALAFVLTYQESPSYIWLWGNLLAAIAIARATPEGRLKRWASAYRSLSFVVLAVALIPFTWHQVRYSLYPQLEGADYGFDGGAPMARARIEADVAQVAPQEAAVEMAASAAEEAAANAAQDMPVDEVTATAGAMPEGMPAPVAAPPPPSAPRHSMRRADKSMAGLNQQQVIQRYAPGTMLQAGPGIPAWRYRVYPYSWSGPVEAGESVRFVYLSPPTLFVWRIVGIAALGLLFFWLARLSFGFAWRLPGMPAGIPDGKAGVARTAGGVGLALLALTTLVPQPSHASSTPDPQLLEQLKGRLTEQPRCLPSCAEILNAKVVVSGEQLEIILQASALAAVAVAIPHASDRWQIDAVSIDGRATLAVAREGDASLWVPLNAGAHLIRLVGRLAPAESIQVSFPQPPRSIDVAARGWTAAGVNDGRLLAGSLELTREAGNSTGTSRLQSASEFPAFVTVERTFNLDLDWSLTTVVRRIAPDRAAITVEVPLVAGESVLSDAVEVRDRKVALVGLASGVGGVVWNSGLARAEQLTLAVPEDVARNEVWNFVVNPQWNVAFEGFPAVLPDSPGDGVWVYRFFPRPGEKLALTITRPKPAAGQTLAIDSVTYNVNVGKRTSDSKLAFRYRSTQGGRHSIKLPPDARVSAVRVDGEAVQLRPDKGELPLALLPGQHQVEVDWQDANGAGWRIRPSAADLRSPASNVNTTIQLPDARWPLFAFGKGVGPAVLYWGELVVFIIMAWLLGRWSFSPLKFHEWLLLGLGLSTQSWWVFTLVAAWLLAMRWRERWRLPQTDWHFNAMQVVLAVFSVAAISALVFSGIRNGLLAAPNMGVAGPGSGYGTFTWFVDQTSGSLPQASIFTAPMWLYRALFFVWATWMAFALVRWLKWAFDAWKTNGLWRGKVVVPTS